MAHQQNGVQFVVITTVIVTSLHILSSMGRGFDPKWEISLHSLPLVGIS